MNTILCRLQTLSCGISASTSEWQIEISARWLLKESSTSAIRSSVSVCADVSQVARQLELHELIHLLSGYLIVAESLRHRGILYELRHLLLFHGICPLVNLGYTRMHRFDAIWVVSEWLAHLLGPNELIDWYLHEYHISTL